MRSRCCSAITGSTTAGAIISRSARLEHVHDPVGEGRSQPVAADVGHQAVHARVDLLDPVQVARAGLELLEQPLERLEIAVVRTLRRQPGERDLEQQARLDQLVEVDAVRLEHAGHRLADAQPDPLLGSGGNEDPATRPLRRADEVRAREHAQRLAKRGPADTELARQVLLAAQPVARAQLLSLHVDADPIRHVLADAAPRHRLRALSRPNCHRRSLPPAAPSRSAGYGGPARAVP